MNSVKQLRNWATLVTVSKKTLFPNPKWKESVRNGPEIGFFGIFNKILGLFFAWNELK